MIDPRHKWIIEELKDLKAKGLIQKPRKRGNKGYANFPIKWSIEGYFKDYAFKERGVLNRAFASYNTGKDRGGIVFIDLAAREKGAKEELRRTLTDKEYVTHRKKLTDKFAARLLKFSLNQLSETNVKLASKKKLWELYNEFREIYTKYEFYNAVWFTISDDLQKIILDKLTEKGCSSIEDIQTIMTAPYMSFINKEHIDLYKAAIKIKKIGDFEDFSKTKDYALLMDLAKKYFWIPFGHVGPELYDEKHYFNEIKKILDSRVDIRLELSKSENYYPEIIKRQKEIIKKYGLDNETVRLLSDLHILIQMQDERKELIARSHINWVNILMQKIGTFFGLNGRQAADIYPEFVEKCLLHNIVDLGVYERDNSTHRRFEVTDPEGYALYTGDDAEVFLKIIEGENSTGLKGDCASTGFAKGRARVLLTANEIGKVEKGDIIVATMTTPDYVPAMRKAAGIITDEGGVTCHAAIVSRELRIPCIINTKNATEVLEDGEMIEMDANKGTIKRISG